MQFLVMRRAERLAVRCAAASALFVLSCAPDAASPGAGRNYTPATNAGAVAQLTAGAGARPTGAGGSSLIATSPTVTTPINPLPPNTAGAAGKPAQPPAATPITPIATAGAPAAPPVTTPAAPKPITPPTMAGTPAPAMPAVIVSPDQKLPATNDYAGPGPFNPAREVDNTGPGGSYTMFRPTNLNANGFKFIPATWGNGITTTPQFYPWLNTVASHGFVIIAANSSTVTPDDMTKGLDWLLMQNDMPGDLQGKLDTSRAVCIGYSLGGGGAVTCGAHPKVIATVAMHPAAGFPNGLHGPLLLFSGTNDTVCIPDSFVQPVFQGSPVPTFYGLLDGADHLEPVLGGRETAPFIAWLRLWVFGDEGAKPFFYGPDCKLCKAPWTKPQSKMLN